MKKALAIKDSHLVLSTEESCMGLGLKEVGFDVLTSEDRVVESRWFHSDQGVDLFVWSDESRNIIKQQMIWQKKVVEWNIIEGLQTGKLVNDFALKSRVAELHRGPEEEAQNFGAGREEDYAAKMLGYEDISYDEEPQEPRKTEVLQILESAHNINDKMREDLVFNIKEARCLSELSHDELLEKYGHPDNPSSLWGKVKDKFFSKGEV